MRKLSFIFFLYLYFSAINSLHAQTDIEKNQAGESPSEILKKMRYSTSQEQVSRSGRPMGDSVRLLQLNKEMLELGTADKNKKQALTAELMNQILRDSFTITLKQQIDSIRSR